MSYGVRVGYILVSSQAFASDTKLKTALGGHRRKLESFGQAKSARVVIPVTIFRMQFADRHIVFHIFTKLKSRSQSLKTPNAKILALISIVRYHWFHRVCQGHLKSLTAFHGL